MKIKSITLKNFRQFISEKIDFSIDPDQKITLIFGQNSFGKTALLSAFLWCFYGRTLLEDKFNLNKKISYGLKSEENAVVEVSIDLVSYGINYTITRKQVYYKLPGGDFKSERAQFVIKKLLDDGVTETLQEDDSEECIKLILPSELIDYFFMSGERISVMGKELNLNVNRKSEKFRYAVGCLTGQLALLNACKHLDPDHKSTSIFRKFQKNLSQNTEGNLKALNQNLSDLNCKLDGYNDELKKLRQIVESSKIEKESLENNLKNFDNAKELQCKREKLSVDIEQLRGDKKNYLSNLSSNFNRNLFQFFSLSLVKKSLDLIADNDISDVSNIPEIHASTINFLINKGECICGRKIEYGSPVHNFLKELLLKVPPHSMALSVANFKKFVEHEFKEESSYFNLFKTDLKNVKNTEKRINDLDDEINQISLKLSNSTFDQVVKINDQIKSLEQTINKSNDRINELCEKIGAVKQQIQQNTKEINENYSLNEQFKFSLLCQNYATALYDQLLKKYQIKEKEILEKLQKNLNEYYRKIFKDHFFFIITDKYNIYSYDKFISNNPADYPDNSIVQLSDGQKISVILSFIVAVIKLAIDNKSESDHSFSEPYPLVLDAPFSTLDSPRLKEITSILYEFTEQIILFIKDIDGEKAEQYFNDKVKYTYYLHKNADFSTKILHS